MRRWGGRLARRLVAETLRRKGSICHLCGLPGADTADHDPPRSVLRSAGVPNPDDLRYLWPAHHRPCNQLRGARPLTPALRVECRAAMLAALGTAPAPGLSARFASRQPAFPCAASTTRTESAHPPPGLPEKSGSP